MPIPVILRRGRESFAAATAAAAAAATSRYYVVPTKATKRNDPVSAESGKNA